jgi:branched-chain amino acid transport system ATP-binding protein
MTDILQVRNLSASYGNIKVLHDVSFDVPLGEVTTLLGANGAGKTTTLRAICGMVNRAGEIHFDGRHIARSLTEDIARMGVAHVPDGRGTFKRHTVDENLRLGAICRKDSKEVQQDRDLVFNYFPILKKRQNQQAGLLSGGEQQMLAVGRALMLRPKLLLLDEPSFGLAPLIVAEIFDIFARLNRIERVSILLVEQNASIALDFATRAYVLETGRIVIGGKAEDVRKDEAVSRSYLGY